MTTTLMLISSTRSLNLGAESFSGYLGAESFSGCGLGSFGCTAGAGVTSSHAPRTARTAISNRAQIVYPVVRAV